MDGLNALQYYNLLAKFNVIRHLTFQTIKIKRLIKYIKTQYLRNLIEALFT